MEYLVKFLMEYLVKFLMEYLVKFQLKNALSNKQFYGSAKAINLKVLMKVANRQGSHGRNSE